MVDLPLKQIPTEGLQSTLLWTQTQERFKDKEPTQVLTELANEILLGKIADFVRLCPSPALKQDDAEAARLAAQNAELQAAGLID